MIAPGSDVQSVEPGGSNGTNAPPTAGSNATELELPEDESEDEDVDFNPFLKESPSEEASSSLSSEVEVLDADVVDSHGDNAFLVGFPVRSKLTADQGGHTAGDAKEDKQINVSHEGSCGGKLEKHDSLFMSEQRFETGQEKEIGSSSGNDGVEDAPESQGVQETLSNARKPIIDLDDNDAICKRTRARYSLVGFTLDELETFLQETDDDDDIQNVDEEEVYRKFLAAVLQGDDGDNQENLEGGDDDDNDADFEIEIEEALESDIDDCSVPPNKDGDFVRPSRRPETRQNRRQKAHAPNRKKLTDKGNRPLRPLLPVMPSASVTPVPCMGTGYPPHLPSSQDYALNGFTSHQIGQLYSLVYEHVQLLIQIYSLCVLEPSRQHISSQVKGLLSEVLHKRDLVLAWRKVPYPSSCFVPSHVQPSTAEENRASLALDNSCALSQGNDSQGCRWFPSVVSPALSVLDVAPMKLVGRYIDDVSNAVREHQRRCVEATNTYLEKQPLFPVTLCPTLSEVNCNVSRGDDPTCLDAITVSPNSKVPKRTLAATLVESTKRQTVALVPRQIAKLAQPFYPLFNPALFPHKPPSLSVSNRVLFTDAEDELLAMGMMEYNNDWKAIQQRFLPCKSEHQIFVRAKNRCSSKAPENPIKTVRKMKTSPLTEEEKARIHEGLKAYKLDWTSIWKFIVPYRDPNLLCRQWRIAVGTQKSYKEADPVKKERRRLYESNRRKNKAAALRHSPIGSEKEDDHAEHSGGHNGSLEGCVDNDNGAYLHEAFLADWRPTSSEMISSKISSSGLKYNCLPADLSAGRGLQMEGGTDNHGNHESQPEKGCSHEVPAVSEDSYQKHCRPLRIYMPQGYPPSKLTSKPFVSESFFSHRSRKSSISNLVKLAPELPPVKLPPAVRVIPQASLRGSQLGASAGDAVSGPSLQNPVSDLTVVNGPSNLVKHVQDTTKVLNPSMSNMSSKKCSLVKNGCPTEGGPDLDPQMHPLLFRTLEEGLLPCYPLSSPGGIPTFSFFPGAQHQINVNLLRYPHPVSHMNGSLRSFKSKETVRRSSHLDFHPLLQRNEGINAISIAAGPTGTLLSTDLELSRDRYAEDDIVYHAGTTLAQMAAPTRPTNSRADANDLDLDIQLSSASRKRKVSSSEGAGVTVRSVNAAELIQGAKQRTEIQSPCSELIGHCPADSITAGYTEKSGSVNSASVLRNLDDYSGGSIDDNADEQPFAEIVMEQEELSDSDEEMEDVEFECEEMADSEGEDLATEQIVSAQNKEQHSEPAAFGASEETYASRKGSTSDSDVVKPGIGSTRTWLSLNSGASDCSRQSRPKSFQTSAGGIPAPSQPNKNIKKATSSKKTTLPGEPETNTSQPASSASLPSRKPKKQTSKIQSPLRIEKDGKV